MARNFLTAVNLNKNELQNPQVHNLGAAPSSPVKGQMYYNTADNTLYWWDGTSWQSAKGGASSFPGYGSVPAETTFGIAKSDGVAATVARSDHTHGSPAHDAAAHSTIPLSALAAAIGDINLGGNRVTNITTLGSTDAASKNYVDNRISGLSWKAPCRCATTANITLSGSQTIDGINPATLSERVLVKNQTNPAENGIYTASTGTWTRASDFDATTEILSAAVFVMAGTTQADTAWVVNDPSTDLGFTLGTSPITWVQFGGPGMPVAGTGMTQSGNTLNVIAGDGSLNVTADAVAVNFAGAGSAVTAARSDHTHTGLYTRKFTAACAAALSTGVTHLLNTRDVIVNVYRTASPYDTVETDVERTDANNVTVRFAVAPAAGEYTIVVTG